MPDLADLSLAQQVARYLSDRNRNLQGGWVSIADIRAALGGELEAVRVACLILHERGLAELMGGFPIRPTTEKFTLARLTDEGTEVAGDPARLDAALGASKPAKKKAAAPRRGSGS